MHASQTAHYWMLTCLHGQPRVTASRAVSKDIRVGTYVRERKQHLKKQRPQKNNASQRKPDGETVLTTPTPRGKESFERTPRATQCADRAHNLGRLRPDRLPLSTSFFLSVCANGARTKRHELKSNKISQICKYVYTWYTTGMLGSSSACQPKTMQPPKKRRARIESAIFGLKSVF